MAGPGDVQVKVRTLEELLPPEKRMELLKRAGAHAIGIIRRRTAQGIDAEGNAFKPYSKAYGKLRAGSGRKSSPVDLTLGGDMLASMTILDVTPERVLIGFEGSSTAYQFTRNRNRAGTKTFKMVTTKPVGGVTRRKRITHTLKRNANKSPVANALKAKAQNDGQGKNPRRHFFALSPAERQEILAEAARTLKISK